MRRSNDKDELAVFVVKHSYGLLSVFIFGGEIPKVSKKTHYGTSQYLIRGNIQV